MLANHIRSNLKFAVIPQNWHYWIRS